MTSAAVFAFAQIILIDMSMAGDNVMAVGLAAKGLPKDKRLHAVGLGLGAATVLRIVFAIFAVQILAFTGLLAAGGLLLLWVAWKMYCEVGNLPRLAETDAAELKQPKRKKLSHAILQIVVADISMSLDNVLAVAGVARGHVAVLIAGLSLSVLLMAVAATYIAKLTQRYPALAYIGVAIVFFTALSMMWEGGHALFTELN